MRGACRSARPCPVAGPLSRHHARRGAIRIFKGTWDFTTITPLQRPPELAGGKSSSPKREAAALEKQINQQRVQTEEVSPGSLGGVPRPATDPGIYNLAGGGSRMGGG